MHVKVNEDEKGDVATEGLDVEKSSLPSYQLLLWGGLCGLANFGASTLAQIGLVSVSAGKAGFITGMYVVFIPLVEYCVPGYGVQLTYKSWLAAALCLSGLYLMSGCAEQEVCFGGAFKQGEGLMLLSMGCWVVSIMVGDAGAKSTDVVSLTYVDFFVCTVLTLVLAVTAEPQDWQYPYTHIRTDWAVLLVVAVAEGLASLLCTMGQMYVAPARASLLMSLEAVSCAALGYIFLRETLTVVEVCGCVLMFSATLISSSSGSVDERQLTEKPLSDQSRLQVALSVHMHCQGQHSYHSIQNEEAV